MSNLRRAVYAALAVLVVGAFCALALLAGAVKLIVERL
jgi:hypothetical protein